MQNDEMIKARQANFRQTNAYAMQNGVILGLWAIICQACFVGGLSVPMLSTLWLLTLLGIPVVCYILTLRFRRIVGLDVNFTFTRGFLHSFLTLLYAAVWAGIAVFVYMQFFDNGYIFDCYVTNLSAPETVKAMHETGLDKSIAEATGGLSATDVVNELRTIGAGNWTAVIIYLYMLCSPPISVLVGLLCIHRVHFKQ